MLSYKIWMKKGFFLLSFIVLSVLANAQQTCPIIPLPDNYNASGETFYLNGETVISTGEPSYSPSVYFFQNQLLRYTGISVKKRGNGTSSIIVLQKRHTSGDEKGSYIVQMGSKKIVISASDDEGMFNGMVSLLQLAVKSEKTDNGLVIPCWEIKDAPKYVWRGFMLDESRHFFGKEVVKLILDQMAMMKLNRFHWHLTDAPGWRLEIKNYPNLTLVGGIGDFSDSIAPAKYYTQQDIREIVSYAAQRYIQVIPEIDMPGHATAANKAYPEFSGGWTEGHPYFTFNPGKEETYGYLTDILREVSVLFPTKMIHLGGDEVSFGIKAWESKSEVKDLMRRENLKSLHDAELYFFRRMSDSALRLFDKVLAWDETADSEMPRDSTIIYWWRHDKVDQLRKAFQKKYNVVLCPRIPLYFDFVQDSTHIQGRRWQGDFSTLEEVYHFSDQYYPVAPEFQKFVLGMQANLWTETVSSKKRLEFLLFPRIAALSEAAWTDSKKRNYGLFLERLKTELPLYDKAGIYYYNPFEPAETPEVVDRSGN